MERTERIVKLHNLLMQARLPIPRKTLEERLECSEKSVRRALEFLRDRLGAPIEYDAKRNGYFYVPDQKAFYQLPGVWLSEKEIYALLTMQQLISHFDPELLQDEIQLLKDRVDSILRYGAEIKPDDNLADIISVIPQGKRLGQYQYFEVVAGACIQGKQLKASYHSRSTNQESTHHLSPQKLIFYRDNWYLAAWCHESSTLKLFSLDRFKHVEKLDQPSERVDPELLKSGLFDTFGIFSGEVKDIAVLKFNAEAARWVENEVWHPNQISQKHEDGSYLLKIPYGNPTELVGEILRRGSSVTVIEPESLRGLVKERLMAAVANYE
ncbi:MAG: hypothetical protein RLZZ422_210 [Pseudomonadota bacterium]|jgi:predicted DNA-binding transcriptional regulator YafY